MVILCVIVTQGANAFALLSIGVMHFSPYASAVARPPELHITPHGPCSVMQSAGSSLGDIESTTVDIQDGHSRLHWFCRLFPCCRAEVTNAANGDATEELKLKVVLRPQYL